MVSAVRKGDLPDLLFKDRGCDQNHRRQGRTLGKVLTFHAPHHGSRVIDAKNFVRLIDENVVAGKKIFAQESTQGKAFCLHGFHVVDQDRLVGGHVIADLEPIEFGVQGQTLEAGARDRGGSAGFELKIRSQPEIDNRHLGAGIEEEIVGARVVDGHPHDHLMLIDPVQRDRLDVRWASRLRLHADGENRRQK